MSRRWIRLTWTTLLSQLALFLVLLLSLRHLGVSEQEVSTAQAFAVFSFGRLISALPITPGGLGVIELGYIGGLVGAGGDKAAVVAAVLLFRTLTFGIQIPLGGFTYLIWRAKKSWRRVPERASRASGLGGRLGLIHRRRPSAIVAHLVHERRTPRVAIPEPSSTPATTSENQCACRYTRENAITNANTTASHSHFRRVAPAGRNASTSATAVAAAAIACPDGNEKPMMSTIGSGGRPRWNHAFRNVRISSDAAHVRTNPAARRHHRRASR